MKKPQMIIVIGLALVLTIGGILWYQGRNLGAGVAADDIQLCPQCYEYLPEHMRENIGKTAPICGLNAYTQVISSGDQNLLKNVPEVYVLWVNAERMPLRQLAADFLVSTQGGMVRMGSDKGGFYLVEPRAGQPITSPVRVKLWHRTDHYGGGILRITDANNKVLAKLQPPEIAHFNFPYHYYEAEITFEQPTTAGGFIVGSSWGMADETIDSEKETAKSIPILFRD